MLQNACVGHLPVAFLTIFLQVMAAPAWSEVTSSHVDISVVGAKCKDRVKEASRFGGLLCVPSKPKEQIPAVVLQAFPVVVLLRSWRVWASDLLDWRETTQHCCKSKFSQPTLRLIRPAATSWMTSSGFVLGSIPVAHKIGALRENPFT
jgi:hypothetical protein